MRNALLVVALFIVIKAGLRYDEVTHLYTYDEVSVDSVNLANHDSLQMLLDNYARLGIKFPIVVLAQSSIETGWWSSTIWEENRNGFGMKYNKRGWAIGKNRGHAMYKSSAYSLMDYRDWQRKCLKLRPDIQTEEDYIRMLDNLPICNGCRYAEDPEYTNKVRSRVKLLRSFLFTSSATS